MSLLGPPLFHTPHSCGPQVAQVGEAVQAEKMAALSVGETAPPPVSEEVRTGPSGGRQYFVSNWPQYIGGCFRA